MSDADRYRLAACRAGYAQTIEHLEGWNCCRRQCAALLAAYGARLSAGTLRIHLGALAHWHPQRGFVDPTKAAQVRDTLREIQVLHPQPFKQAAALQLQVLQAAIEGLGGDLQSGQPVLRLWASRD